MKSDDLIKQLQQDAHYLCHDEIASNFAISQRIKLAVDYIKQLEAQLIKSETARQKQAELLSEERSQKYEQINRIVELQKKREFHIDTPLGKLKVYSKHDKDYPKDFPGVFVDLVRDSDEDIMIACVEFDSVEQNLLATIYGQLYSDIPTDIRHIDVFNIEDLTDEQVEAIYGI